MTVRTVGNSTRLAVVIGDPVAHSLSPAMHNAAFAALGVDAVFLAMRVPSVALGAAVTTLARSGAIGASVTVPHKVEVLKHCSRLSETAQAAGAVNCLEFAGDEVVGHNTDALGFVAALEERYGEHPDGWRPLLLGGGGAARAVAAGLAGIGSSAPVVIARNPSAVEWTSARPWTSAALAGALAEANLVVDCTSAGLSSESERALPAPIDLGRCAAEAIVCSLIYHRDTLLLAEARALGLGALDGLGMLVHQALAALDIWLARAPDPQVLWRAVLDKSPRRRRGSSGGPAA